MTTTYTPTSVVTENWGRLQVVIDNKDRTFWRGVPTLPGNWTSAEPFDDKTLTLNFPGITSFEELADLPFKDFDSVEIWLIDDQNNRVKSLWDGFVASHTDDLEADDNGLSVECLGSLYQADFFLKAPSFQLGNKDAAFAIAEEMNLRSKYYGLRLNQMNWLSLSSTPSRSLGSWNPLLTGWAQELLANSYSPAYMQDGERAVALQVDKQYGGYEILGDYYTVLTFGPRMPNYGSGTWWNSTFIHLFGDDGFYCSDIYMNPTTRRQFSLTRGGTIDIRDDNVDGPGQWTYWQGDATAGLGRSTAQPINRYRMAIHSTDDDRGYRVVDASGKVYCFGNATHHGDSPALSPRRFANGQWLTVDYIVDMVRTKSGNGYWLLSWGGRVFAYGDATPFSHFPLIDTLYTAIEVDKNGTGVWALDAKGRVQTRGTAVNYGSIGPNIPSPATGNPYTINPQEFAMDISRSKDGNGYVILGHWGGIFTKGDAKFYRSGVFMESENSGSNVTQWTMMKGKNKTPIVRTKNTWTTNHTCTVGTPGISHSLTRDRTQMPNTFYGEGVDPTGCKWRNTRYPNFNVSNSVPPLWPGYLITVGVNDRSPGVSTWQLRMRQNGWPITVDGIYDNYDMDVCRFMQSVAGIQVDGVVGPQTWAVTFEPGANAGKLDSAYIAPLVLDRRVEPFTYSANGATTGKNPSFDKRVMRIESYTNYGDKSSKRESTISATNELVRNRDPGYYGTITFAVDPETTSRFEIKAGQNIEYKGYRGEDILLHVTEVTIDFNSMTASCTVDTKARDNETVMAMIERDRAAGEPVGVPTRMNASSRQTEDKVIFDCESAAGFVPWFYVAANLWSVIRIPLGEVGSISKTEIVAHQPNAKFSVGVFDRIVHPSFLVRVGGGNPGVDEKYWQDFDDDRGLMMAWGRMGDMGGYFPGQEPGESEEEPDPWTGKLTDGATWQFWSSSPPWVWVAFWSDTTTVIGGRFWPGGDSGFNFAGSDAIANPMEIHPTSRPTSAYFL
jgi:peptidoglycan hydrolase-like protein with peptidoglycan-binding domain